MLYWAIWFLLLDTDAVFNCNLSCLDWECTISGNSQAAYAIQSNFIPQYFTRYELYNSYVLKIPDAGLCLSSHFRLLLALGWKSPNQVILRHALHSVIVFSHLPLILNGNFV